MVNRDFRLMDWRRREAGAFVFPSPDLRSAKIDVERDKDGRVVALRSPDASAGFYVLRWLPAARRRPAQRS